MDGYSACIFLKSTCNEEGQVLHSNGTTKSDITCRCDYTEGYAFVKIPKQICYCDPIHEDCSCYKMSCGEDEVLTEGKHNVIFRKPIIVCLFIVYWFMHSLTVNIRCNITAAYQIVEIFMKYHDYGR